jgi:hypothetical protein
VHVSLSQNGSQLTPCCVVEIFNTTHFLILVLCFGPTTIHHLSIELKDAEERKERSSRENKRE